MARTTRKKQGKSKRQRARRSSDWRPAFLSAFAISGVQMEACRAVPVDPVTVWKERKANETFATLYEEARIAGAQLLEEEATRRAVQGVRKLKFYEGVMITVPTGKMLTREDGTEWPEMVPYVEHEYSDRLLELLLKRHFPTEYREKLADVNVTATASASVTVTSDAELAKFQAVRESYLRRLGATGHKLTCARPSTASSASCWA